MNRENERRFTLQIFLLIFFWGIAGFTLITQLPNLPEPNPNPVIAYWNEKFKPNPYTYHPLEYDPFNNRMTLIEAWIIWVGFFYGLLRIYNMFRIMNDDAKECVWADFFELCENINNSHEI